MQDKYLDFINKQLNKEVELTDKISTLGVNSLDFIKLLALVEREFDLDIDIYDLDIAKYETIGQLISMFSKLR